MRISINTKAVVLCDLFSSVGTSAWWNHKTVSLGSLIMSCEIQIYHTRWQMNFLFICATKLPTVCEQRPLELRKWIDPQRSGFFGGLFFSAWSRSYTQHADRHRPAISELWCARGRWEKLFSIDLQSIGGVSMPWYLLLRSASVVGRSSQDRTTAYLVCAGKFMSVELIANVLTLFLRKKPLAIWFDAHQLH